MNVDEKKVFFLVVVIFFCHAKLKKYISNKKEKEIPLSDRLSKKNTVFDERQIYCNLIARVNNCNQEKSAPMDTKSCPHGSKPRRSDSTVI